MMKQYRLVVVFLALILALASMPALAQSGETLFAEGVAAYQNKDFGTAIAKLSRALPLLPSKAGDIKLILSGAYLERGSASLDRGDFASAIADCTKGIELSPGEDVFFYCRGRGKYSLEDYDGAFADYEEAIRLDPSRYYSYEGRGKVLFVRREWARAIADFSKAIELKPDSASSYSERGEAKHRMGDEAGAIADCGQALKIDSSLRGARLVRAWARIASGDKDGALADLDDEISRDPGYYEALKERRKLRHERKDYEGEAADYLAMIAARPAEKAKLIAPAVSACIAAGDARYAKGEYREASAQFGAALELDTASILALDKRALARAKGGDHAGAVEDYSKLLSLSPKDRKRLDPLLSAQYEERGADRSASGDYAGAAADYAQAAASREGNLSALHLAADRGDARLITAMLRSGTPPNAKDSEGATALMHAVEAGSLESVKALVSGKADPKEDGVILVDKKQNMYYGSLLCVAAGSSASLDLLRYLVESCKLDVNQGSLIAGKPERSDLVPAFWACFRGNYEKLEYLLRKGANPSAVYDGSSLLRFCLTGPNKDERFPALLLDKKAAVDKTDASLIAGAADKGFVKVLKRLLDAGIPASARMPDGSYALHFAARSGQTEAAALLLKRGADVDASFPNGATALHFAAQAGHAELISLLVSSKATIGAKAKVPQGGSIVELTPLDLAKAAGQTKAADLLTKAGAQ